MRRLFVLVTLAAVLAAPGSAVASDSFSDPSGDAPAGPDILAVAVEAGAGAVAFRFTLAATPGAEEGVRVAIDADESRATGTWILGLGPSAGYDYVLTTRGNGSCSLSRADEVRGGFQTVPSSTLSCATEGPAQTLRVALSELGGTGRFAFSASSFVFDVAASRLVPGDVAPNCGLRVYDVALGAEPPGAGCSSRPADEPERWLRVRVKGRGTVTSSDDALQCPPACDIAVAAGDVVTLRARAGRGYVFRRWSGACSGRRTCRIAVAAADVSVTATFVRAPKPRVRRPRR